MSKPVVMHATGAPGAMRREDHDPGSPRPGQIRLHQKAAGLNCIDAYHRTGRYPLPARPVALIP